MPHLVKAIIRRAGAARKTKKRQSSLASMGLTHLLSGAKVPKTKAKAVVQRSSYFQAAAVIKTGARYFKKTHPAFLVNSSTNSKLGRGSLGIDSGSACQTGVLVLFSTIKYRMWLSPSNRWLGFTAYI